MCAIAAILPRLYSFRAIIAKTISRMKVESKMQVDFSLMEESMDYFPLLAVSEITPSKAISFCLKNSNSLYPHLLSLRFASKTSKLLS